MAFTFSNKINSAKDDRTVAVNSKKTLVNTRADTLEEDILNDHYFDGDSYPGINSLIYYYYRERQSIGGDTYYFPEFPANLSSWKSDWDTIISLALGRGGDETYGIYPPDENGIATTSINVESPYLNLNGDSLYHYGDTTSNGDTIYIRNTCALNYLRDIRKALGDTIIYEGDTYVSGDSYASSAIATANAKVFLYGDSIGEGSQYHNRYLTGTGIIGRRSADVEIDTHDKGGGSWVYLIGDGDTDNPTFYGDSIGDTNGFFSKTQFKTPLLNALNNFFTNYGDTTSTFFTKEEELRDIWKAIEQNGDTNPWFIEPDIKTAIGDSYAGIRDFLLETSRLSGETGDDVGTGDTNLYGIYTYLQSATGNESNFNAVMNKLREIVWTGDTNLEQIFTERYNSIDYPIYRGNALADYEFIVRDEAGGDSFFDYSYNYHTIEYGQGTSIVKGKYNKGSAIRLTNGDSGYLKIADSGLLDGFAQQNFTITADIKIGDTSKETRIWSYDGTNIFSQNLGVTFDGAVHLRYNIDDAGKGDSIESSSGAVTKNEWTNIIATFQMGDQKIYVNGSQVANGFDSGDSIRFYEGHNVWIGRDNHGLTATCDFDNVAIYNKAFSEKEVERLAAKSPYNGVHYKTAESDFTALRYWRLFWLRARAGKPKGSKVSYEALGDALTDANNQITITTEQLKGTLGDSDYYSLQYIPTPNMYAIYFDPKRDQDTGTITERRISMAFDGQQHATHYQIFRKHVPSASATEIDVDEVWGDTYHIATQGDTNPESGFIKVEYTDKGDSFSSGTKYIYRVRVLDTGEKVDGDTVGSLQSELFDDTTGDAFSITPGDSRLDFGDSHGFEVNKYIVINGTGNSNGYYKITRVGDTYADVTPNITGDSNGTAYQTTSTIFITE